MQCATVEIISRAKPRPVGVVTWLDAIAHEVTVALSKASSLETTPAQLIEFARSYGFNTYTVHHIDGRTLNYIAARSVCLQVASGHSGTSSAARVAFVCKSVGLTYTAREALFAAAASLRVVAFSEHTPPAIYSFALNAFHQARDAAFAS